MKYVWVVDVKETTYRKNDNAIIETRDNLHSLISACTLYKNLIDAELDIIYGFKNLMSGKFIWKDGHFTKRNKGWVETTLIKDYGECYTEYKVVIYQAGICTKISH